MITFERDDTNGYEINYGLADVNDICNKEKKFPAEWITAEGTDISDFRQRIPSGKRSRRNGRRAALQKRR